jgi:hypothetical protein
MYVYAMSNENRLRRVAMRIKQKTYLPTLYTHINYIHITKAEPTTIADVPVRHLVTR